MNLQKYYENVLSGETIESTEILHYIKTFKHIVLWGASYLGQAIAKRLLEEKINQFIWWDTRFKEIETVYDVKITEPFSDFKENSKDDVLVIFCIGNTALMPRLLNRLKTQGYSHILRGDRLFMGLLCPYDSVTGVDGLFCNGSMICRSMFCGRLQNIVKKRNDKGGLFLDNLTFMITTHCSLKCKYCVAYINSYPIYRREFYPYEQISADIDAIFNAVDAVGSITVQGGEPFLHPHIDKIIKKLLEKQNLGIISVATNGIFKLEPEKLKVFQNSRLNVAFSGYYDALPKEKLDIYYQNIQLMKLENVPHTVGVKVPEWIIPSTLWNQHYSEDIMKKKKENCKIPERCMQVVNGKLYPCLYGASLLNIGIADYPEDYIELSGDNLTERISNFINKPYYNCCGHCSNSGGTVSMAGEQGYYDFITPR